MYVALGDSMSIDDYAGGAGWGAASLLHRNRDADFPAWAGRDLASAGLTGSVLAWDGAAAADVLECQLPLITEPPAVVTITMGGNDLLMAWGRPGRDRPGDRGRRGHPGPPGRGRRHRPDRDQHGV
jgi:lysophospholipase L1-like esterase